MVVFNKKTDKIAIIAPSSACDNAPAKLSKALELLSSQGFFCKFNKDIFITDQVPPFFSAPKSHRMADLTNAFLDPEVKIIWAFRGGYGASELVFDFMEVPLSSPKILIGFSDITALHFLFHQHYSLNTIHGPVLTSLIDRQASMLNEIMLVLDGKITEIKVTNIKGADPGKQKVKGEIIGGNLTMICNMIGTKLHPITRNKILFLEDVNEKGYHIHRHLIHMYNAGLFTQAEAVIFGDFTESDELKDTAISDFCTRYLSNIPVFKAPGIGHGAINHPIVIGSEAEIVNDNLVIYNNKFRLV